MVAIGDRTYGNARRVRQSHTTGPHLAIMATVTCESCGHQFAIEHRAGSEDAALASRQAAWLAERLVWDHIQEKGHTGSVPLPFLS